MKILNVVAAVICDNMDKKTKIFATQRSYGEFKDGWEFPGGKVEPGEAPVDALKREIREELNTEILVGEQIDTIEYDYATFHLSMQCFWCEIIQGDLELLEHEDARWLTSDTLDTVAWLPADISLIDKVRLEMGSETMKEDEQLEKQIIMQTQMKNYSLMDRIGDFDREKLLRSKRRHIRTGFEKLDAILGGGLDQGLYVLGAMSNLGKSTFALQMAQNITKAGVPVLYFSMEMPGDRILSKCISRECFVLTEKNEKKAVKANQLMDAEELAKLDEEKWGYVEQARMNVAEEIAKLHIVERGNQPQTSLDIKHETEAFIETYGEKPVVIVDYLQILLSSPSGDKNGIRQNVDKCICDLSSLANNRGITVFVISSFNRESYKKSADMSAFKESGTIEYSADVALGLQLAVAGPKLDEEIFNLEKAKSPRDMEIVILKQRYGRSGNKIPFYYYSAYDYFEEVQETGDKALVKKIPEAVDKTNENAAPKRTAETKNETKKTANEANMAGTVTKKQGMDEFETEEVAGRL